MVSRRTLLGWIGLGVLALGTSGALAFTLVRLGDVTEQAQDLKDRLGRMRERLLALEEKPGAPAATFDWRSLVRRVERLEQPGAAAKQSGGVARAAAPAASARLSGAAAAADSQAGDLPQSLPTKLLAAEPFRSGLQEFLKTGTKKMWEERKAEWRKKWDERFQQEVQTFAKSAGLNETQAQSMTAIVQDDRDQRKEIRRQVREGEIDNPTAKKQIDALNANTKTRLVESVGDEGYQKYQQQKEDQRQLRRSLRRF